MNHLPPLGIDSGIHAQMMFLALFGAQVDCYEPETARHILRALTNFDSKSGAVAIKFAAMRAMEDLTRN
jgi:hypothetical protein